LGDATFDRDLTTVKQSKPINEFNGKYDSTLSPDRDTLVYSQDIQK